MRGLIILAVIVGGLILAVAGLNSSQKSTPPAPQTATPTIVPDLPIGHVSIANSVFRKGGLGSVLFATFTVKNDNAVSVRDISISCSLFGKSGTKIGKGATTIFDIVPARKSKKFSEVSLGLIDPQTDSASCEIVGLG